MAIKINNQTVVSDSKELQNIASIDATTVATLGTALPTPAIESDGAAPTLASGITAAEVRSLIGAGTGNSNATQSTPAINSNGTTPSLASGITGAEVRSLIGAGTGNGNGNGNSNLTNSNVSISGSQLSDDSVTAAKLANNIRTDIGAGTGNGNGNSNLTNGAVSISGNQIADGSINTGKIVNDAITVNKLANNIRNDIGAGTGNGNGNGNSNLSNANVSISGNQITNGTINTSKIAADAITVNKLANNIRTDIGAGTGNGNGNSNQNLVPAVYSNGNTPTLSSGISAAEMRSVIGAGTGNGNGNGNSNQNLTPAVYSNGNTPSLSSGISAAEMRNLIGAGTGNGNGNTSNNGDITAVTAGNGLSGGANSGGATLNIDAGTGITVNANGVAVNRANAYNASTGISINNTNGAISANQNLTPAVYSNGNTPSLSSGISAAEMRNLIGAGTGNGNGNGNGNTSNNGNSNLSIGNNNNQAVNNAALNAALANAGGGWDPTGNADYTFSQNDLRNGGANWPGGTNGAYGSFRIRTNGTVRNGLFNINGNNGWMVKGYTGDDQNYDGGSPSQTYGNNGQILFGWYHIPPGANMQVASSQQIAASTAIWNL